MNDIFVISEGCLENIQEIYTLKTIFKDEAWTLKILQLNYLIVKFLEHNHSRR